MKQIMSVHISCNKFELQTKSQLLKRMRMIQKIKWIGLITLLANLILFTQCTSKTEKKPPKVDPAFTGYVSAFTSGIISKDAVITIKLRDETVNATPNQKIEDNVFSFKPSIKGEAYWVDKQTIEFRPDSYLESGKLYDGVFKLGKLIEVPKKLQKLDLQFQTKKQSISVYWDGMSAYDANDLSFQKQEGQLRTFDISEDDKIEKLFTAVQNGKKLKIRWEHAADGQSHRFIIDSLKRGEKKSELICEWNGSSIGSTDNGSEMIEIPPLGDFKVTSSKVHQHPQQHISVFFSDPVDEQQDLEGLIYFDKDLNTRFVISDNEVKIYPTRRLSETVKLKINTGVKNVMGYQLSEEYERKITFSSIKPAVELIGNGVILPSTKGLIFPFKAVNLSGVNVKIIKIFENNIAHFLQRNHVDGKRELKRFGRIVYKKAIALQSDKVVDLGTWNSFALDLSEMIKTEPGAIYRVHLSFDKSQSLYPCSDDDEESDEDLSFNEVDSEIASYDNPNNSDYYYDDYYYDYNDGYNYSERNNPCKKSYYLRNNRSVVRNVFASDLGIIAKGGDASSLWVAISDLKTTALMSGVDVEIYNYQNQLINKAVTNAEGLAEIELKNKPFLLVARKGDQIGYLRLDDGSALSMSMFDIGGNKTTKGVKGFIYGERGVWRPGDSLFVSFILEDKNKTLPADHPVVFELFTPENQLYLRKVRTHSLNGFYDFRTATDAEAPTGNWLAKVKLGGTNFTKTIKIETVKPNRLKIKLDFPDKILKGGKTTAAKLQVNWLHGAVAKNLEADIQVNLEAGKTKFDAFPAYYFDDAAKSFDSQEKTVFDGKLNAQGKADVSVTFNVGQSAPGMLKAKFKTRAFEKGGDFSTDQFSLPYSPFTSYVGVKVPKGKGWHDALYSNEKNLIPIVSVDENGKPVSRKRVKIEIFEIRWRWWWENSYDDDLARYVRNQSRNRTKVDYINTTDGKAMYEMNLNRETWGRKYIRVTDPVSGHSCGQEFYTSYKGWWSNSTAEGPGGAEMLNFSTNKSKYNVGEDIRIELPTKAEGKALVSIESGSKVVDIFWIETSAENKSFNIKATEAMAPNVYVHISYVQPHGQVNNDLPIRLYGVQAIRVEDPSTHLSPVIEMADVLAPEEEVEIKVSEANGKKMTYTLAVVDEGLLDLTRFRTPNAWANFYAREALGVKTWDMYKYVMGAITGEMSGLLALGGDEDLNQKGGKKANRFKPVVKFFGPFELNSGSKTHKFLMPNYVGSIKVMLVAGYEGAYGKTDKVCPVKKPLMVLGTLPRVVGPGEKVKLPANVFAMDAKVKKVKVSLEANDLFEIEGKQTQELYFEQEGDEICTFDLKVKEKVGIGKVKIIAQSGSERAEFPIELDVRLPNPRTTKVIEAAIEPGKTWKGNYTPIGIKGTNNGKLEVSQIPSINLENRLKYLIRYPHGCIEQTTSSVFPQLHLSNLLELSNEEKIKIEDNIRAGINRLKKFQISNGGMTYWPGSYNEHASDWGTNYAGHFMIEAKAKGYSLPSGFLKKWIRYQRKRANDWVNTKKSYNYKSDQLIQAYRLYTLALAGKPALGAMNRMREISNLSVAAKWRLAAAYQLAGRKKVASSIINKLNTEVAKYNELSYSYGNSERDQAMILETLVLMNKITQAKTVLDGIAETLSTDRWLSTQTTAYSLLAVSKFVGDQEADSEMEYAYKIDQTSKTSIETEAPVSQINLDVKEIKEHSLEIENKSEKVLFVKLQLDGIPMTGTSINHENDLKMQVRYTDMKGKEIDPTRLIQGTDFIAEVRISHPGVRVDYKEMALTQIFPSGWEIRNMRMDIAGSNIGGDHPRYQDIRDDRVYTYFDIQKHKTKTFKIVLNAAYLGKFYLPNVYCEAMYDNTINATKAGKWVEVLKTEAQKPTPPSEEAKAE